MEANEIKSLIESLGTMSNVDGKGFLKKLATSKFVVGSALIAGGITLINAVKNISLIDVASSLFPQQLLNVSLAGMPIGGLAFKLASFSIAGILASEAIKVVMEIKLGKSSVSDILLKEFVSLLIMVCGILLLGKLGIDLLNAISNISVPAF